MVVIENLLTVDMDLLTKAKAKSILLFDLNVYRVDMTVYDLALRV